MGKGVTGTTGTAGPEPDRTGSTVQQVFHRPTGACHHHHIIPPSRLCAGTTPLNEWVRRTHSAGREYTQWHEARLKRLPVVVMLATGLSLAAYPSLAQSTPDEPAPIRTFDETLELVLSVLTDYSTENFTWWIRQEVPALEIRVSSLGQADALQEAFGELPSAVPVVVGDLGINLPVQPTSVTQLTYDEKIDARDALTRRANSRYVDLRYLGLGVFVTESGIVFAQVSSEEQAALVRQFFGPDVWISGQASFGGPIESGSLAPMGRRVDSNIPLAMTALAFVTVLTVAGGLYWRRRIGVLRYAALIALPTGVFVALMSLGADRLLPGHPGFGRYQTAGVTAGATALAFGAVALIRSRASAPKGIS